MSKGPDVSQFITAAGKSLAPTVRRGRRDDRKESVVKRERAVV